MLGVVLNPARIISFMSSQNKAIEVGPIIRGSLRNGQYFVRSAQIHLKYLFSLQSKIICTFNKIRQNHEISQKAFELFQLRKECVQYECNRRLPHRARSHLAGESFSCSSVVYVIHLIVLGDLQCYRVVGR